MKTLAARWQEISLQRGFTSCLSIISTTWYLPSLGMWPDGPSHLDQWAQQEPERNVFDAISYTPPRCWKQVVWLKVTSAALLIMAFVTTPVCPRAAPRASPGKMYLVGNADGWGDLLEAGWVKKNYSKTAVVSKAKLQSFATDKKQRKAREKQS